MSKLWIYGTSCPYGVEKSGGITYFKVLLDPHKHDFVITAIRERENLESKKKGGMEVVSSLKEFKNGKFLLRIRVKVFRGRMAVKMGYEGKNEDYLKTIDEIDSDHNLNIRFSLGDGYIFNWEGESRLGINIYLEEIVIV